MSSIRYLNEAQSIMSARLDKAVGKEYIASKARLEALEQKFDDHDLRGFIQHKLEKQAERLILEKQVGILQERLKEMINEKTICDMMLASLQDTLI